MREEGAEKYLPFRKFTSYMIAHIDRAPIVWIIFEKGGACQCRLVKMTIDQLVQG
jgi:hypothetical protein